MTVADRIKTVREKKSLSQDALAQKLGLKNRSSISRIEKSGNDITLKDVERIASALDVSVAYLMGFDKMAMPYEYKHTRMLNGEQLYLDLGDDSNKGNYYTEVVVSDYAQKLMENKELRLLFDAAKDAKKEDLQTIHTMLLALKAKENRGDDD